MTEGASQGLFVIVAVAIFGIFVVTANLLFGGTLNTGLGVIFDNGLDQVSDVLDRSDDYNFKSGSKDEIVVVKIREANTSKGESEVWIKVKKMKTTKTASIVASSSTEDMVNISGTGITKGSLVIPDKIDGYKVTNGSGFDNATFNGTLKLSKYTESIGIRAFANSKFTGDFIMPENLKLISSQAFSYSKFTNHNLTMPNSLVTINNYPFESSEFTGDLILSDNLTTIGNSAFKKSKFSNVYNDNQKFTYKEDSIRLSNGTYYSRQ